MNHRDTRERTILCPACAENIEESATECPFCHTDVREVLIRLGPLACPHCTETLSLASAHCPHCGRSLSAKDAPQRKATRTAWQVEFFDASQPSPVIPTTDPIRVEDSAVAVAPARAEYGVVDKRKASGGNKGRYILAALVFGAVTFAIGRGSDRQSGTQADAGTTSEANGTASTASLAADTAAAAPRPTNPDSAITLDSAPGVPVPGSDGPDLSYLVPAGWRLTASDSGFLSDDEREDFVFILERRDLKNSPQAPSPLIAVATTDGRFDAPYQFEAVDSALTLRDATGEWVNSPPAVRVSGKTFRVRTERRWASANITVSREYVFRHQNGCFQLIGFDADSTTFGQAGQMLRRLNMNLSTNKADVLDATGTRTVVISGTSKPCFGSMLGWAPPAILDRP